MLDLYFVASLCTLFAITNPEKHLEIEVLATFIHDLPVTRTPPPLEMPRHVIWKPNVKIGEGSRSELPFASRVIVINLCVSPSATDKLVELSLNP